MKRIILSLVVTMLCLVPVMASAAGKVISVSQFVEHPALDAVLKGTQDYFRDNKLDVTFNVHNAQANMATTVQIAAQIMGEQPDLVIAIATPSAQACAQKIHGTPILATAVTDHVGAGLVKSMEHPGGNVSGTSDMLPVARQLDLIREFHPGIKTLGVIYNSGEANSVTLVKLLKDACDAAGIKLEEATVLNSAGIYQAAKSLVGRAEAIFLPTDNTVISALESVVKVCRQNKLPLYAADNDSVERGTIAALAFDYYKLGYQTGAMAKRILFDGANVSTMPVESLQELSLHVNLKAAEAMGVTVPESVLSRAEKVIK